MMLRLGVAAAAAGVALTTCGVAHADGYQDSQYVACVNRGSEGIYSSFGPSALAQHGRQFARDIASGIRTASEEREWVYLHTASSIDRSDAAVLVNCAVQVYLYGVDSTGI